MSGSYEWGIAEYGFAAYKKIIENQMIGSKFEDNIKASLGMPVSELYKRAAPHILSAFSARYCNRETHSSKSSTRK